MKKITPTAAEVKRAHAPVSLGDLSAALSRCLPFVDTTKDGRFQMGGIHLEISERLVIVAATDGRRACRVPLAVFGKISGSGSIVIDPPTVKALIRLGKPKHAANTVGHINLSDGRIFVGGPIKGEVKEVVGVGMPGRFPKTDDLFSVLYPTYAEVAIIDADELRASLESIWGEKAPKKAERCEPDRGALLVIAGRKLHVSGMIRGAEHRATASFQAGASETRAVTLDADYVLDFLRTLPRGAGAIGLHVQHHAKVVGLSWGSAEVVVMPKTEDSRDEDPIGKAGRRFLESLAKPSTPAAPAILADTAPTPEPISDAVLGKPRRGVNAYLAETIDFGGVETPRGEVIATMQAEGHPQRCIDAYMMGADSRKATLERMAESEPTPAPVSDDKPSDVGSHRYYSDSHPWQVGSGSTNGNPFYFLCRGPVGAMEYLETRTGRLRQWKTLGAANDARDECNRKPTPPAVSAPAPLATLSDDDIQTVTICFHALPVPVVGIDCGYCGSAADTARLGGRPATADQLWKLGRKRLDREQAEARRAAASRAELIGRLYAADERLAILDPEEWARELELDRQAEMENTPQCPAGHSRALVILPETDRTRGKAPSVPATAFTMDIDGKAYHVEPRPALPGLRAYSVQRGESDYAVTETTSGRAHCECADFLFRHVDLPHSDGCRHIKRLVALGLLTNRFPTPAPTTRPADADPGVIRQTDYVTTPTVTPSRVSACLESSSSKASTPPEALTSPSCSASVPAPSPSPTESASAISSSASTAARSGDTTATADSSGSSIPPTASLIRWRGMRYQRNGVAWKTSAGSALAFDEADREHAAGRVAIIDMGSNITAHPEIITGGADSIGDRAQNITDTPVSITPCPRTLSGLIAVVRRSAAPPIAPAFRAAWMMAGAGA